MVASVSIVGKKMSVSDDDKCVLKLIASNIPEV